MKLQLSSLFFAAAAIAVTTSATSDVTSSSSSSSSSSSLRRSLQQTYQLGTKVFFEFDDGWYYGTISGFSDGQYTVSWEDADKDTDVYDETAPEINTMVAEYLECTQNSNNICDQTQLYEYGTVVSLKFPSVDGDNWYDGVIQSYDKGTYTIKWEDGAPRETDTYRQGDAALDIMVHDGADDGDDEPTIEPTAEPTFEDNNNGAGTNQFTPGNDTDIGDVGNKFIPELKSYEIGTKVYGLYPDKIWYAGSITSFDDVAQIYTVTWEGQLEDGDNTDTFGIDDAAELDDLVKEAQFCLESNQGENYCGTSSYPTDTPVSFNFVNDGGWYYGTITNYVYGTYTVTWDDRDQDTDTYQEGDPDLITMVENGGGFQDDGGDGNEPTYEPTEADEPTMEPTEEPTEGGNGNVGGIPNTQTYDVGALVYYMFPGDGWYAGEIKSFDNGIYTIAWDDEDQDEDTFQEGSPDMSDMINNAIACRQDTDKNYCGTQVYPFDTPVSFNFVDDGGWYDGFISDYNFGTYIITWDDADQDEDTYRYDDPDLVEMVQTGLDNIGDGEPTEEPTAEPTASPVEQQQNQPTDITIIDDNNVGELLGTKVYYEFPNEGWYAGQITAYSSGQYTVTWEDEDEDTDNYGEDSNEINTMINQWLACTNDARNICDTQMYAYGTPVTYNFQDDGGWYDGIIESYDMGTYTVRWNNDDTDTYRQGEAVLEQMVSQGSGTFEPTYEPTYEPTGNGDVSIPFPGGNNDDGQESPVRQDSTASSSTADTSPSNNKNDGLSGGAKFGIVIVSFGVVGAIVFIIYRKRRSKVVLEDPAKVQEAELKENVNALIL